MWNSQSTMGFRDIRHMDLFGMFGKTSWPWSTFIICTIGIDGQMERHRIRENEGTHDSLTRSLTRSFACSIDRSRHSFVPFLIKKNA